jgi:excisionase family DNA binding protein
MVPREAAKYLRMRRETVIGLLHSGEIDSWRDANGYWRISQAALDRYIAEQEEQQRQRRRGHDAV